MVVLQIEHPVSSYDGWKKVFDNDPMDRKGSGVKSYKIFRQHDEPNNVIVELEFDELDKAKNLLVKLKQLWGQVEGTVITSGPKARIIEMTEAKEY